MKRKTQNAEAYNASEADYPADIKEKSPVIPKPQTQKMYTRKTDYVLNRTRNSNAKQKQ